MNEQEIDESNAAMLVEFYRETRSRNEFIGKASQNGFKPREAQKAWFIIDRYVDIYVDTGGKKP